MDKIKMLQKPSGKFAKISLYHFDKCYYCPLQLRCTGLIYFYFIIKFELQFNRDYLENYNKNSLILEYF